MLQQVDPLSLVETNDATTNDPLNSYNVVNNNGTTNGPDFTTANNDRIGSSICQPSTHGGADTGVVTGARGFPSPPRKPLPRFELPRCVSGRLPGELHYVRATLPTAAVGNSCARKKHGDGVGDADHGCTSADGGSVNIGSAVKSFAAGAIATAPAAGYGGAGDGGKGGNEDGSRGEGTDGDDGGYCLVRVDSLDRVCDVIYCGKELVEAKNLSKIVGVQMSYLQVRENIVKVVVVVMH